MGLNSKPYMTADAHGMPVSMILTESAAANSTQSLPQTEDFPAGFLLVDKGYCTNAIVAGAIA